ncbi:extracellular solute-binding protein [Anaerocolumna sedimenticola]|uniref:Extracellular solute-binding protein n=1 Tax=Anaerocolumna sedimenticola TaxID=2696063 RepID=A0A6P1TNX2_9FIRM|nr:extracellular solute-binding protein [Anaerocolumna sedimenticola]QHQ61899.1 extracellular solute-binding protein [Anaerocolumna sedimenticola]
MKKLLSLTLIVTVLFTFTACSSQETNSDTKDPQNQKSGSQATERTEPVNLDGEVNGEITVYCYDSTFYKNYLEAGAKEFEAKYPGTKVNIESFSTAPEVKSSTTKNGGTIKMITNNRDTKSENDYINRINTELMTGEGPDILAMDILPYYKYAENGQLVDLNAYMDADKDFQKEDYRQNVLEATNYKGGQYIFPMGYNFDVLGYDKTILDPAEQENLNPNEAYTYDQLIEIGQDSFENQKNMDKENPLKMFDRSSGSTGAGTMFNQLFQLDYKQFVDIENKTANFTGGQFEKVLETVKEYEENGYLNVPVEKKAEDMLKVSSSQSFLFRTVGDNMLLQAFDDNNGKKMNITFNGGGQFTENDEIAGILKNDKDQIVFDYTQAYAMNANSQNKNTSWAFLKYLAGEEMQTSTTLMGCPVNIKAGEEKAKLQIQIAGKNAVPLTDKGAGKDTKKQSGAVELDEKQTEIFNNYNKALNQYSDMLNTYMIHDTVIDDMVNEEVKYFFDGSKSAKEVAEILQGKVELYLNE